MEETLYGWRIVEVACGGRYGGKVEGCGGKNFRFWCQTILQIDYFNYEGREVG